LSSSPRYDILFSSEWGYIGATDHLQGQLSLAVPFDQIADFCQRHHILRLAYLGSAIRQELRPDSDVDVLVEFAPDKTPGLAFFAIQDELSQILGHPVALNTAHFISPYFRQRVQAEAQVVYEQT
jgi:predicted nucleotidyltransferase